MDNAYLEIRGKEVEVLIDNFGCIDGFMIDGKPVDMRADSPDPSFILEHMDILMEEAAYVIEAWKHREVMSRAYWGEG